MTDKLIPIKEVAERTGLSVRKIRQLVKEGKIEGQKISRQQMLFDPSVIDKLAGKDVVVQAKTTELVKAEEKRDIAKAIRETRAEEEGLGDIVAVKGLRVGLETELAEAQAKTENAERIALEAQGRLDGYKGLEVEIEKRRAECEGLFRQLTSDCELIKNFHVNKPVFVVGLVELVLAKATDTPAKRSDGDCMKCHLDEKCAYCAAKLIQALTIIGKELHYDDKGIFIPSVVRKQGDTLLADVEYIEKLLLLLKKKESD